jgi:hypothetical protein
VNDLPNFRQEKEDFYRLTSDEKLAKDTIEEFMGRFYRGNSRISGLAVYDDNTKGYKNLQRLKGMS